MKCLVKTFATSYPTPYPILRLHTMLEFRNVGKTFPGVQALSAVSFEVQQGEVHALMGENGAGKSTLMKILSGVYPDYDGQILWEGQPLQARTPRDAEKRGIAIIHQELNLIPELSIAENIFLGRELRTRWGTLDSVRMEREASALLERLNLPLPPNRAVKTLRVGEQQLVEVARALSLQARLLILDEPTSALSEPEIERLYQVVDALREQGVTMIYISHKLDEIFRLCDRITVLRDGQYAGTRDTANVNASALIRLMVGREMTDLFPKEHASIGEEILRVENLNLLPAAAGIDSNGRALHEISFALRRGEIVGVAGLMGAGRTELMETLFGVPDRQRVRGTIRIAGQEIRMVSPRQALDSGLAFVTEDRKGQSLLLDLSIANNITLAALENFLSGGLVKRQEEAAAVRDSMQKLHVKAPNSAIAVGNLSGGNQQKVVIAKCLLTKPKVLLLDEPTRGIDVGAKAEIYALISQLAQSGAGVLMVSSEMPELLAMCDRVLVLCEGRLTAEFSRAEATQERILEAATAFQRARAS